jgi:hypothetical protein
MSQKIDDVLQILAGVRSGYQSDAREPLRKVRLQVIRQVAEQRRVDQKTIADTYIRRLTPEIRRTAVFDHLVEEWLASRSPSLQRILENHVIDHSDPQRIREFFASGG